jgi:hypothetical protein
MERPNDQLWFFCWLAISVFALATVVGALVFRYWEYALAGAVMSCVALSAALRRYPEGWPRSPIRMAVPRLGAGRSKAQAIALSLAVVIPLATLLSLALGDQKAFGVACCAVAFVAATVWLVVTVRREGWRGEKRSEK